MASPSPPILFSTSEGLPGKIPPFRSPPFSSSQSNLSSQHPPTGNILKPHKQTHNIRFSDIIHTFQFTVVSFIPLPPFHFKAFILPQKSTLKTYSNGSPICSAITICIVVEVIALQCGVPEENNKTP
jgi:hypothetical protein